MPELSQLLIMLFDRLSEYVLLRLLFEDRVFPYLRHRHECGVGLILMHVEHELVREVL